MFGLAIFCNVMVVESFNSLVVNAVTVMKHALISSACLMSEVLTVLLLKIGVLWDVMLCR